MRLFILALIALLMLSGCCYDHIDFKNHTFERVAFLYDAQIAEATYDPDTNRVTLKGYDGKSRIDAIIAALEAAR